MARNYSSDPNNALPISDSVLSQSGAGPDVPEDVRQQTPPLPGSASVNAGGVGSPDRLNSGTVLSGGRYKIEKLVASGGMGAVYRATDTRFNRPCAVKEMLDHFRSEAERAQSVEWFSREATLLLDLNHSCIPRVRDFFAEEGRHYLVMDFIEGRTLAEALEIEEIIAGANGARGITETRAREWTRQICNVLTYLHQQTPPIIFRDLKPQNIMVTTKNEIKLIDFGIARTFQSQRQATVIMTLGFAPPEQLQGMPEPRSDLYSLGATIYRLLTRHDATRNKPNIFSFPPLRLLRPDISPAFEQVIMRALAPNLEQRWTSAEEMERALITLPPVTTNGTTIRPSSGFNAQAQGSSNPALTPAFASGPYQGAQSGSAPASTGVNGPAGAYITAAINHLAATPSRIDDAYDAITHAHPLEPNNALVHKVFGQIYARRQPRTVSNIDHAIQAYTTSLRLDPNDASVHKLLGDIWLYLRPNPAQAIPAYVQSVRLKADDFETHERLGLCYEKTNQLELSVRAYQEALRCAPQGREVRLRLHFALGLAAWRAQQLPVAEYTFVQVLILNPADSQARYLLSQVYEREGKLAEAFTQCSYIMNTMGNNPSVQQFYQNLKNRLGR
ncbi:MAG TPA: serine/threonine-protein kinase [Dictyobacter sp.]|jgi:serine/threonine protein kinase|nr:serine/threonine-protein kinase [Dictyobacter sp.]